MGKTRFVTFYSYKGGVGRTLALANVAWKAAQHGERVVIIDFDLEAPGIRTILPFRDQIETHLNDKNRKGGFFEAVLYFQQHRLIPPLRELYATDPPIPVPGYGGKDGVIYIVPAGREDAHYKQKLQEFNWSVFFEKEQGWEFFHNLRQAVEFQFEEPDWVLIDSRTGLTDIGGICTLLLPDKVVLMTGLNEQNLKGCKAVMDDIHGYSRNRKGSLAPIEVVLVASHVPDSQDLDKREERLELAKERFGRKIDLTLPYVPILSLEERVLVQERGLNPENPPPIITQYAELYSQISSQSIESFKDYFRWVLENCGTMDADKLYGKGQTFPLALPEIFIPLYADGPDAAAKKGDPGGSRQAPVDIEVLIARHGSLLIEGQAGSGKTTLLKHLAFALSGNGKTDGPPEGLEGCLPVLILLKHVEAFFREEELAGRTGARAEDALAWYFANPMANLLSFKLLDPFLSAGKVLFLVDGLDEIRPANRDKVVDALADQALRHQRNRIVLAGRPHGLEGTVVKRFGSRRVQINSLTLDQIGLFIEKWFAYLYPGRYSPGRKNAAVLIAGIKSHPATGELVDNPLMLTAVCILYHDNKELPDQRVELYRKFVDNLLYRRFVDPEQVHLFLATLACRMHAERVRAVDWIFVLDVMKSVYKKEFEETDENFRRRLKRIFDDLEPRCGLLRMEGGQYAFWHLTFQEYLTAVYLVDNADNQKMDIVVEPFWNNDWYKEVVELFIGYLSIFNKKTANAVVAAGMASGDEAPFKRWRLACLALVDIPEKRREEKVVNAAQQRLLEVVGTKAEPAVLADAGEILGRLGDPRDICAFVSIPGGTYEFKERGKIDVEPFEIGKYPVTNSWFAAFIQAGGYEKSDLWSAEGRKWLSHNGAKQSRFWDERRWNCPNAPVVGVCWFESDAFCRWLTTLRKDGRVVYRLPDENQWEAAAAGKKGREYPWGKNWKEGCCNSEESKIGRTSAVGIFKAGNTPKGEVADLAGNVWEWTCTDYKEGKHLMDFEFQPDWAKVKQRPVLRGGSWSYDHVFARCAYRDFLNPELRYFHIGFRCVRTLK